MRRFIFILCLCWLSSTFAQTDSKTDRKFAEQYFKAWQATQRPDASEAEIDAYLSLLTDDVGYQHLPYVTSGLRTATGKAEMKKGMMYYLGSTSSYQANLEKIIVGHRVIVIQFHTKVTGVHPDTSQPMSRSYRSVDVLELDEGKVAVIRHYSE